MMEGVQQGGLIPATISCLGTKLDKYNLKRGVNPGKWLSMNT